MTVTVTWGVETLERETASGKVLTVHYSVKATDGTYNSSARGQVSLDGDLAIPYADLTETTVIEWVQNALGAQLPAEDENGPVTMEARKNRAVASVENFLTTEISEQVAPTRAAGTPW